METDTTVKKPNRFITKLKEDIVVPICLLSIVIVCVGAALYFIIPEYYVPSLGMTLDEFKVDFEDNSLYTENFATYNMRLPEMVATASDNSSYNNYFNGLLENTPYNWSIGIQGTSRKIDGELTMLRVIVEYTEDDNIEQFMMNYFGCFLQTIYPELSSYDAASYAISALYSMSYGEAGEFTRMGDYAYRVFMTTVNGTAMINFDIVSINSSLVNATEA